MARRSLELESAVGRLSGVVVTLAIVACSSTVAPQDRIEVTLVVEPESVALGDTIHLLGVAFNPTAATVDPDSGCAPGIGFYVTEGAGQEVSLYDGLAFTCPLLDSQIIEPGETDSVRFEWVPASAGAFQVRSALVFGEPRSPSAGKTVTVR